MSFNNQEEIITLRVKAQDSEEVHFKIKSNTPLKKLMEKYSQRIGKSDLSELNFLYDGVRVNAGSTPQVLGMRNGDELEAVVIQVGGGRN
jgi:small ubiquitin-related modifier